MAAKLNHTFDKGFLLNEEHLRKIKDIISNRVDETSIKYNVSREDSFLFKTDKIEDIIKENNLKREKIKEITLTSIDENADIDLKINFELDGVKLSITGADRDTVFLLASELKNYISSEVCTVHQITKHSKLINLVLIGSYLVLITSFIANMASPSTSEVNAILDSNNINEKINFLITKDVNQPFSKYYIVLLVPMMLGGVYLDDVFNKFASYFFPSNLFLFGKEQERYDKRMDIRSKFIWVIAAGLIISIVAGVLTNKLNLM